MIRTALGLAMLATLACVSPTIARGQAVAPLAAPLTLPDMPLHDPFILADRASGTYYLYTSNDARMTGDCAVGTMVYQSRDLAHWSRPRVVFRMPSGIWATSGGWAPEVHAWKGRYYLFTTLHNPDVPLDKPSLSGWKAIRRGTVLAVSDRPEGPFTLANKGEPVVPADRMTLDGTLYVDPAGKPWFVYAHEWIQVADGTIEAMPLTDGLTPAGKPVVLFRASDAPWVRANTPVAADGTRVRTPVRVTDGPELVRFKDGSLLMLWSSYDANGYVQSVARSASGRVQGPWTQLDPLVRRDSGHGMIFETFDGKTMLVLHRPFKNARGKLYEVSDTGGNLAVLNERVDLDRDHVMPPVASQPPASQCRSGE